MSEPANQQKKHAPKHPSRFPLIVGLLTAILVLAGIVLYARFFAPTSDRMMKDTLLQDQILEETRSPYQETNQRLIDAAQLHFSCADGASVILVEERSIETNLPFLSIKKIAAEKDQPARLLGSTTPSYRPYVTDEFYELVDGGDCKTAQSETAELDMMIGRLNQYAALQRDLRDRDRDWTGGASSD